MISRTVLFTLVVLAGPTSAVDASDNHRFERLEVPLGLGAAHYLLLVLERRSVGDSPEVIETLSLQHYGLLDNRLSRLVERRRSSRLETGRRRAGPSIFASPGPGTRVDGAAFDDELAAAHARPVGTPERSAGPFEIDPEGLYRRDAESAVPVLDGSQYATRFDAWHDRDLRDSLQVVAVHRSGSHTLVTLRGIGRRGTEQIVVSVPSPAMERPRTGSGPPPDFRER